MNLNLDIIMGVFIGIAMTIFGLVGLEMYEARQERKRRERNELP